MTDRFDPNIPPTGPTDPAIQGEFTGIVGITERPAIGKSNLVVDGSKPFEIDVSWHIFGNLTPLWLTALSVRTKDWVVTAYAESQGPGDEVLLGTVNVPVRGPNFSQDEAYRAKIRVPANTLPEEDPGNRTQSGVYKIIVTTFLDSDLGPVGYDMMGYAEGPIIKVEDPR
ncbi:hypothetical protein BJ973_008615 [Actinoplanes tereljensis]|uniref:Uncharacterized protein n=1 Tax=Paractinoplanes tereljensis TaxID=571912 RepID=A0A919TQM3_9ACTN|nr:hypothetical protein [Actinoplanes tereljensis]GIF18426.1 hypothetical protein Ate02nite_11560 [Actinoplanes tereljensis]